MDASKVRSAKRHRFAEILGRYREQHALSLRQLADLLGKPRSTVQYWLSGRRMPRATELRRLCARINVNFDMLFSDKAARDFFFEIEVIGMDALQRRYFEVKQEDPLDSLDYLALAGALIFNRLVRAGLECRLEAKPDYTICLRFHEAELRQLTVLVHARGMEGIGFSVIQENNAVRHPWVLMLPHNVDSLIDIFTATAKL